MAHQSALIESDIDAYLKQQEQKDLLRFLTCGSVDDGKSTLIGRLLHDARLIYEDQLKAISRDSAKSGTTGGDMDLALLVDGLQAEREQGITIDVAYRFFSTARRKFIIADTPGHEQYTRNMATGASTADLALILIDACNGVLTQTLRHSMIAALLGIRHFIVAINKMDRVNYAQEVFARIRDDYTDRLTTAGLLQDLDSVDFVPLSALKGDNVVERSEAMPWYTAPPLMEILETLPITQDDPGPVRLPVQYVNRPDAEFRGYCGSLASGCLTRGEAVTILPAGRTTRIGTILNGDQTVETAHAPMAITVTLADAIDVSRGDTIVASDSRPPILLGRQFAAVVIWMAEAPLSVGSRYALKFASRIVSARINAVVQRMDPDTLSGLQAGGDTGATTVEQGLQLNEIAHCQLTTEETIACDPYRRCAGTGAFIIIDRLSNLTAGAGMITRQMADPASPEHSPEQAREHRQGHRGTTVCLTVDDDQPLADGAEPCAALARAMQAWFAGRGGCCALIDARRWQDTALVHHLAHCAPALNGAGLLSVIVTAGCPDALRECCQDTAPVCRHIPGARWQEAARDSSVPALRDALLVLLDEQEPAIILDRDRYLPENRVNS